MKRLIRIIFTVALLGMWISLLSGCGRTARKMNKIKNEIESVQNSMERVNEINKERENLQSVENIAKKAKEDAKNNNTNSETKKTKEEYTEKELIDMALKYYEKKNGINPESQ